MPYKVLGEEVNILRQLSEYRDPDSGKVLGVDNESVVHFKDEIVADEDVAPVVVAAYDRGDKHVRSLLLRVDEKGKSLDKPPPVVEEPEVEAPRIISKEGTGQVTTTPIAADEVPTPARKRTTRETHTE